MSDPRKRANIMLIGQRPDEPGRALKYDPEFCWTVRLLAQGGKFPEEWCADLGITMSTLYAWANRYPEFEEAVLIAWHLLNAYWTDYARKNLLNKDLRTAVLLEILRKRFPETWGKSARNTQDTFEARPRAQPEDLTSGTPRAMDDAARKTMDERELEARIAALEQRRRHDGTKNEAPE